jgi:hypothetical protein
MLELAYDITMVRSEIAELSCDLELFVHDTGWFDFGNAECSGATDLSWIG